MASLRSILVPAFVLLTASVTFAKAGGIRTERVRFAAGSSSAVVEGSIRGYEGVDYVLGARQGQTLNVSMATPHTATYFNLLAPGEDQVAFFIGSTEGGQYEGVLPETGDYKVRVYMMRSAARRDEVAAYRLEMSITGPASDAEGEGGPAAGDALVEGTPYHATGSVPCAVVSGQPAVPCAFGVVRRGNGSGIVTVTKPDGRTRAIFFENGAVAGSDRSQADPRRGLEVSRESDLTFVRIGDEHYEIPDAVVFGG